MNKIQLTKFIARFNRQNRIKHIKIVSDTKKISYNYYIYELKLTYTNKFEDVSTFYIEKKNGQIAQTSPNNELEKEFFDLINRKDDDQLLLSFNY